MHNCSHFMTRQKVAQFIEIRYIYVLALAQSLQRYCMWSCWLVEDELDFLYFIKLLGTLLAAVGYNRELSLGVFYCVGSQETVYTVCTVQEVPGSQKCVNILMLLSPSRFPMPPRPPSVHSTASSTDSEDCDENYVAMVSNMSTDEPVCNTTQLPSNIRCCMITISYSSFKEFKLLIKVDFKKLLALH